MIVDNVTGKIYKDNAALLAGRRADPDPVFAALESRVMTEKDAKGEDIPDDVKARRIASLRAILYNETATDSDLEECR